MLFVGLCKNCCNFVVKKCMRPIIIHIFILFLAMMTTSSCVERKVDNSHPWGDDMSDDTVSRHDGIVTLPEIISNGEIIVATMSGPDTYYDYRGVSVGSQYMLMKRFAEHIGVMVRVEVCEDTVSVLEKVREGAADVALLMFPKDRQSSGYICCGAVTEGKTAGWFVNALNTSLAEGLDDWYKPQMMAEVAAEETRILSGQLVERHVYSFFLDRAAGVISSYDDLFKTYSATAGCDWRLLASICYQESCFDPQAKSFAGASGLMQLMPATAESMGLPREEIFEPEKNIAASARYISHLRANFSDIGNQEEMMKFVLAAYNGGSGHIRDAMALAKADGKDSRVWNNVAPYVLALMQPQVYRRPQVRYGYMRGVETVNYVSSIFKRWYDYRGVVGGPDIYSAKELSVDDIIGDFSSDAAQAQPDYQPQSRPAGDYSAIDRSADHSVPTPASSKRKSKFDVE